MIEGWVLLYNEVVVNAHTWIQFNNGKKLDPTKSQFDKNEFVNYVDDSKYRNPNYSKPFITKTYTPKEYIEFAEKNEANTPEEKVLR